MSSTSSTATTTKRDVRLQGLLAGCLLAALLSLFTQGCATTPSAYKAFHLSVRANPDQATLIKGVPKCAGRTIPTDAACVCGAARFWKRSISNFDAAHWFDTQGARLSPPDIYLQFAWHHDLYATAGHANLETLIARIKEGIPPIVLLQGNALYPSTRRYALALGFNDVTEQILVRYGDHTERAIPYERFGREWRVNRNWMLLICPPDRPSWELNGQELADRARFYDINGDLDSAARDYQAAIDAGYGQSEVLVRLGNTHRKLEQDREAEAMYRRALAADPHNARAYNNLAYLLAENGKNLEEAEALARQALILDAMNPFALDTLGFVLSTRGRFKDASDVLERARARAKHYPAKVQAEIAMHLALAHYRNGQEHLAKEVVNDAIRKYPDAEVPDELRALAR